MYILTVTPFYIFSSVSLSIAGIATAYLQSDRDTTETLRAICTSKVNVIIQLNTLYILLYLFGRMLMAFFIGKIRKNEFQLFQETMVRYSMTNLLFVFYVLSPSHLSQTLLWIAWFTVIGFLKLFAIVGRERSKFYMSSLLKDNVRSNKLLSMLWLILISDTVLIAGGVFFCYGRGLGVTILVLFECWILLLEIVQSILNYSLYRRDQGTDDTSIAARAEFTYISDFVFESVRLASTVMHFIHIWKVNGYSRTVIDFCMMYLAYGVAKELKNKVEAFMKYMHLMNIVKRSFPNASKEDIERFGDLCAICHDTLDCNTGKRLPCSHIYHAACVKQWIQTKSTCPICMRQMLDQQATQPVVQQTQSSPQHDTHPEVTEETYNGDPHHAGAPTTETEAAPANNEQEGGWSKFLPFTFEVVRDRPTRAQSHQ